MADALTERYRNLLDDCYDCVDRIVLNAYNTLCSSAGGFRHWWRCLMNGSDEQLDNAHLMRMAGRFGRRVRGFAKAHQIPTASTNDGRNWLTFRTEKSATVLPRLRPARGDLRREVSITKDGKRFLTWWRAEVERARQGDAAHAQFMAVARASPTPVRQGVTGG